MTKTITIIRGTDMTRIVLFLSAIECMAIAKDQEGKFCVVFNFMTSSIPSNQFTTKEQAEDLMNKIMQWKKNDTEDDFIIAPTVSRIVTV